MKTSERSAEWQVMSKILQRIVNRCRPLSDKAARYHARGITVCERWRGRGATDRFIADLGYRPHVGLSVDRIDNSRGYEPRNVRWSTPLEQSRNTRQNRLITFRDKTQPLSAWTADLGVTKTAMRKRLATWPLERALTEPANSGKITR